MEGQASLCTATLTGLGGTGFSPGLTHPLPLSCSTVEVGLK